MLHRVDHASRFLFLQKTPRFYSNPLILLSISTISTYKTHERTRTRTTRFDEREGRKFGSGRSVRKRKKTYM